MTSALIVVDVQNDFCEGGSLAVSGGKAVAAAVSTLLEGEHGYNHVIATRDRHIDPGEHFSDTPDFVDSWPPHCVVGTPGSEFVDELRFRDFEEIFDKGNYEAAYSGFEGDANGTTLAQWLRDRGVDQVDVVGLATDFCVKATAADAVGEGFTTTVLTSLTAAVAPDNLDQCLASLAAAGVRIA